MTQDTKPAVQWTVFSSDGWAIKSYSTKSSADRFAKRILGSVKKRAAPGGVQAVRRETLIEDVRTTLNVLDALIANGMPGTGIPTTLGRARDLVLAHLKALKAGGAA